MSNEYKLKKEIFNDFFNLLDYNQKLELIRTYPVLIGMIHKLNSKIQIKIAKWLIAHYPYLLMTNSKVKTKITDKKALFIINEYKDNFYKNILIKEKDVVKACCRFPHFLYYIGDFLSKKEKENILKEIPEYLFVFNRVSKEMQRIAVYNLNEENNFMKNGSFNKINDSIALGILLKKLKNIENKEKVRKHKRYREDASLILDYINH